MKTRLYPRCRHYVDAIIRTGRCLISLLVVVNAAESHGQMVVDAGGPENVFYTNGGNSLGLSGLNTKLSYLSTPQSPAQSAEVTYFSGDFSLLKLKPSKTVTPGIWIWGMDLKVTAVNGIAEQNDWPQTSASALINYTDQYWQGDRTTVTGTDGSVTTTSQIAYLSNTVRYTFSYGQDPMFDKTRNADDRFYTQNEFTSTIVDTFSFTLPRVTWLGVALSAGYSATDNYTMLPKASAGTLLTTSSGKTLVKSGNAVRYGTFEYYNAFPLTLLLPLQGGRQGPHGSDDSTLNKFWDGFSDVSGWIGRLFSSDANKSTYIPILAPYISFTPADRGKPANVVGLNFALRALGPAPANRIDWDKQTLAFPINVFVERTNAFAGKPDITIGAGLSYKFP